MTDQTGKVGGKRVLDDYGNWISLKSLSKEVQDEIASNSKKADASRRDKALRGNKEYAASVDTKAQEALRKENHDLKELVKSQGEMLAEIDAKLELGAEVAVDPAPEVIVPKKLTPKQKLQAEAEEKGIEFEEDTTIADLKELITQHDIDELEQDKSEEF